MIETTLVAGSFVSLTAMHEVGRFGNSVDTAADTLSISTTGSPSSSGTHGIAVREVNAVTVETATTADGSVSITAGGDVTALNVSAGGNGLTPA